MSNVSLKAHKGDGHRKRLRNRFLNSGLSGFHDYEVIELLLSLSTPRKDCKETAKSAIKKFKTLQGVIEASSEQLCEIKGIGAVNLLGIKLVKSVAERYLEKTLIEKYTINNSKTLFDYLYHSLGNKKKEYFKVIFLDVKNRVIETETLFTGTLTSSAVYPREVVVFALKHNAAGLIFAHNHPSGDTKPSAEDISITRKLIFACGVMGIIVHEHIIIGESKYFSFADNGYIEKMKSEFNNIKF
jgi:DNA repair protein RadC